MKLQLPVSRPLPTSADTSAMPGKAQTEQPVTPPPVTSSKSATPVPAAADQLEKAPHTKTILQRIRDLPGAYTIGAVGGAIGTGALPVQSILEAAHSIPAESRNPFSAEHTVSWLDIVAAQSLLKRSISHGPAARDCEDLISAMNRGLLSRAEVLSAARGWRDAGTLSDDAAQVLRVGLGPLEPDVSMHGLSKHDTLKTVSVCYTGPLFINGPVADDVLQGAIGDCYLAASAASIAQARPQLLRDAITQMQDLDGGDFYRVRFYDTLYVGLFDKRPLKMQYVDVYPELLTLEKTGRPLYGNTPTSVSGPDSTEVWWPVLEQAWAKFKGRGEFDKIVSWRPNQMLQSLTGVRSTLYTMKDMSDDSLLKGITQHVRNKDPMSAWTQKGETPDTKNFVPGHAYSLLNVTGTDPATAEVTVRNPWGKTQTVAFSAFVANFRWVAASPLPTEP